MIRPRKALKFLITTAWTASSPHLLAAESINEHEVAVQAFALQPVLHMAAFGDSITRAFNANGPVDHPWNSWSTGNSDEIGLFRKGQVKSHAEFLEALTGQKIVVHNVAKSGARSKDIDGQIDSVSSVPIHYATMLIGANDLCAHGKPIGDGKQSDMTQYPGRVEAAIRKLTSRNPSIKILLVSIPDMARLQRLGHGTSCQAKWTRYGICQNLLRNDISAEELSLFERQWQNANDSLREIAARYPENVLYNGRLAEYPFEREHLSDFDCFHPNIVGQNLLSSETWSTGWWGH